MKTIVKFASVLLLALLVFVPLQAAGAASGAYDGQVIFGQSFTLQSGETLTGDLLVFGGSATIEDGATVNGSVVLFGGSLTINGNVSGDVAVTGGSVTLGPTAHVHGNLTTIAASLARDEHAQVDGQTFNTATSWTGGGDNGNVPQIPVVKPPVVVPNIQFNFQPLLAVWNAFAQSLALAVLAMLLMLFLAPHAGRVANAVVAQPLIAGGLGLLTVVVAPIAIVLTILTLILIPVSLVIVVALFVAGVFGWIAIGYEVGQRFTKAIHQDWHPAFSAGLGTFALTLVAKALTDIPVLNCVGWLVPTLLGLAALGAVLMTRFGTQAVMTPSKVVVATPADASGKKSG